MMQLAGKGEDFPKTVSTSLLPKFIRQSRHVGDTCEWTDGFRHKYAVSCMHKQIWTRRKWTNSERQDSRLQQRVNQFCLPHTPSYTWRILPTKVCHSSQHWLSKEVLETMRFTDCSCLGSTRGHFQENLRKVLLGIVSHSLSHISTLRKNQPKFFSTSTHIKVLEIPIFSPL